MSDFIKKAGVSFWLNIATGVLALVGAIILIVTNGTTGYALENAGLGITFAVISLVLVAVATFTSYKYGEHSIYTTVLKLIILGLISVEIAVLVSSRAELVTGLLSWDSHNALGWSVFNTSLAGIILLVLANIVLIVSGFLGAKKKD